jgi:hypothetical protein
MAGRSYSEQARMLAPGQAVQMKPRTELPKSEDWEKVWDAHPHNYQSDESQNTSGDQIHQDAGWDEGTYANTCAIRVSIMWNKLGGDFKITRDKAKLAGIDPKRVVWSKKSSMFYILSAREMWTYMSYWHGAPHQAFPGAGKRFKSAEQFEKAWATIQPVVAAKRGIVAFDKIFGYSGTGHVDIFDGEKLSNAASWYPCQELKLWFI